jgi:hypothetical protein
MDRPPHNRRPPNEGTMRLAPPLSTGEAPPPDDVEALLRAYFRAEMPDPWPAPPLVLTAVSARPELAAHESGLGLSRSKLALAASVALLVAGSLLVPVRPQIADAPAPAPRMLPGEATRIRLTETLVQPRDKPTEFRIEVTEEVPPGK